MKCIEENAALETCLYGLTEEAWQLNSFSREKKNTNNIYET